MLREKLKKYAVSFQLLLSEHDKQDFVEDIVDLIGDYACDEIVRVAVQEVDAATEYESQRLIREAVSRLTDRRRF